MTRRPDYAHRNALLRGYGGVLTGVALLVASAVLAATGRGGGVPFAAGAFLTVTCSLGIVLLRRRR